MSLVYVRSPLRISLGGGGTDLPSYYQSFGGFLVAGAINKYIYLSINKPFGQNSILKYSEHESVSCNADIKHPIIRACLSLFDDLGPIEITSVADIPGGTGLGSSGAFTSALLKGLYQYKRQHISDFDLAELACHVELNMLSEPIGKQDQYAAVFGGLTAYTFNPDGTVCAESLKLSDDVVDGLNDNLLLFFTGFTRSASNILSDQKKRTEMLDPDMLNNLHYVKEMGYRSLEALTSGNLSKFGELMHEHWMHKRNRSESMSNGQIDIWYESAINNGAIGGKIVGAGGGGFLLLLAEDKSLLRKTMKSFGLREVRFDFDFEGTKVL
ncbi:MAG: galactokinase [Gammaproteobacteria bacterium]|nr:galactokinase [Gammaproteobacteria bacterium]